MRPADRRPRDRHGDAAPLPGKVFAVTSLANPRVKSIAALALPKNRRESGLFVAEGLKLVADALDGGWSPDAVVHATDVADHPMVQAVSAKARARGADILGVSEAVLARLSRRDNPQTVLGVFHQRLTHRAEILPEAARPWVALEAVRDPGNLGTILRTVDAAGGAGVILVGDTVDPFGVEAVRATMGSIFHVGLVRMTADEFLAWRRTWPGLVVGTHLDGAADYREVAYDGAVLLVMGNEQAGLSAPLAAACDALVRIPQAGRADSLNLAVATAVMLFEIQRRHLILPGVQRPAAP